MRPSRLMIRRCWDASHLLDLSVSVQNNDIFKSQRVKKLKIKRSQHLYVPDTEIAFVTMSVGLIVFGHAT